MCSRGAFILFEGLDNAGKTTQVNLLAMRLRERSSSVVRMQFPDYSMVDEDSLKIKRFLNKQLKLTPTEVYDAFASQRTKAQDQIRSLLEKGTHVLMDRYSYSGLAYGLASGVDFWHMMKKEFALIKPDLVFYMTVDPVIAAHRKGEYGQQIYDTITFQTRARDVFNKQIDIGWRVIDGERELSRVVELVNHYADDIINDVRTAPIARIVMSPLMGEFV